MIPCLESIQHFHYTNRLIIIRSLQPPPVQNTNSASFIKAMCWLHFNNICWVQFEIFCFSGSTSVFESRLLSVILINLKWNKNVIQCRLKLYDGVEWWKWRFWKHLCSSCLDIGRTRELGRAGRRGSAFERWVHMLFVSHDRWPPGTWQVIFFILHFLCFQNGFCR